NRRILAIAQCATGRALWNDAERDRFRPAQMRCSLIKVKLTRRADSFNVSAIGREMEIRFKYFCFRIVAFKFERINNLPQLPGNRSRVKMKTKTRDLHCDGRSAGSRMLETGEIDDRSEQRERVYARMSRIVFV